MNTTIISELSKLASKEQHSNNFKYRAYKNAINSLSQFPTPITNSSQVANLKGIGKGILQKIDEILEYGQLQNQPTLPQNQEILQILTNIYGIGYKKAITLINDHKITNLQTLKDKQEELLNEKQKIGLKYYYPLLQRIPKQEMDLHKKYITNIWENDLSDIPQEFTFEIVGSYRRNASDSGDIDILVTFDPKNNLLPKLIKELKKANYIIETLAEGNKKFMGICRLPTLTPRRIDIMAFSPKEYPFGLLYFTGSDKYNRNMREHANRLGYKLNEKCIIPIINKTEKIPEFTSEEEIVAFLKLPYIHPHNREGSLTLH